MAEMSGTRRRRWWRIVGGRPKPRTTSDEDDSPASSSGWEPHADAGPASMLAARGALTLTARDGSPLLIIDTPRGPIAIDRRCPHMGARLLVEDVHGRTIRCREHGLRYDLRSGVCASGLPLSGRLRRYEVCIDNGRVVVDESSRH